MSKLELPVFGDNLKSSASWQTLLLQAGESWQEARAGTDSRSQLERRLRDRQAAALVRWGQRAGIEIDERRLREAAGLVSAWAGETGARLDTGRFLELHRVLIGAAAADDFAGLLHLLRKTEPLPIAALHDPTPAVLLPRMLDHAFDWFTTPGFGELHPVEQAAVVYLRLLDLHPFPPHTEITALLAAGFYSERAGLPPLIVAPDDETLTRYRQALEAAFRMLTQPLVEFFAELLRQAMLQSLSPEK